VIGTFFLLTMSVLVIYWW